MKFLRALKITAAITLTALLIVALIISVVAWLVDRYNPEPPPTWLYISFLLTFIVGLCKIIYDSQA